MGTNPNGQAIQKVFIIMMENSNWANWSKSASAPYLKMLLTTAAHAEAYYNPAGNHPSLPNYLWLEAGTNFGIKGDGPPSQYHQPATTDHLVTQLEKAGHSWKAYVENIDGASCPLTDSGLFVARHTPMLFFDDVTNDNDAMAAR